MCIDTTTKELEGVMLFFEKYRNEGFESNMNIAKSLAFDMKIESIPLTKHVFLGKNNLMRMIMMKRYKNTFILNVKLNHSFVIKNDYRWTKYLTRITTQRLKEDNSRQGMSLISKTN